MIIEKIGTGATVEEAFNNAKVLLEAPDDAELHQEILEYPKKRLFKSIPAKIKVWYEKPDEPVSAPMRKENAASAKKETAKLQEIKKTEARKQSAPEKKNVSAAPVNKPVSVEAEKESADSVNKELSAPAEEKRVPFEIDENDKTAELIRVIAKGLDIDRCDITGEKDETTGELIYNVSCGEADGALIGRRGETLDAIQYLLRLSLNRGIDDDKHRKVSLNVGNYREKRNANLRNLAAKSARQVLKYGRNVALEPMNPYERRIIHTAIQGIEGVTSHSVGSDGNRKVIISLAEGVQPTHPSKGGYAGKGRGSYAGKGGKNGSRGGYRKREPYQPSVTRAPRKDNAGSLYGRIDIPNKTEE